MHAALLAAIVAASVISPAAPAAAPGGNPRAQAVRPAASPVAVAFRRVRLTDRARGRTLVTEVRYPADRRGAPYPLVVFGHGFALTPGPYARLLDGWTRAGYVVAAPIFPRENANAPGGPTRADLPNQPRDISAVISGLVARDRAPHGFLSGLIDPHHIAAAGHSDGGMTALAATLDPRLHDTRISAAVILAGARIGGTDVRLRGPRRPALLAVQGTGDTINSPGSTYGFYGAARRPKFLLRLLGAEHLPPFTTAVGQLRIVERVSVAFLDRYLKGRRVSARRLGRLGNVRGRSDLTAEP
jgi:fermentation-respiration switch protein FrsA (DUF1100 family)